MNNNDQNNKKGSSNEALEWVFIIIAFAVFWPVGLGLLIRKLSQYYKEYQNGKKPSASFVRTINRPDTTPRTTSSRIAQREGVPVEQIKPAPAKKDRQSLESVLPTVLLILGAILLFIGAMNISDLVGTLSGGSARSVIAELVKTLFYLAGGGVSLFYRGKLTRKRRRKKQYLSIIGERSVVRISEIAEQTGFPEKVIKDDLGEMIEDGAFGENAFIDIGLDSLVRSYDDAENERQRRYAADKAAETANAPKSRYNSILDELQNLNDAIEDEAISEKIEQIQSVTAKIFNVVEEKPEKLSEIRKFMDYYLPTTLKLLRSYATLENQGIEGDNINSAKSDIGRILDTLSHGFEQQLDQLFKSDVIDISSDINVLESMMEQDGLAGENPFGQQMGGH